MIDEERFLHPPDAVQGRQRGARDFTPKGQDVRATLEISLEDSISGATRRIQFSDGRTLDVTIPKGAGEGQVIRLRYLARYREAFADDDEDAA